MNQVSTDSKLQPTKPTDELILQVQALNIKE